MTLTVPLELLDAGLAELRTHGARNTESIAFFLGRRHEEQTHALTLVRPVTPGIDRHTFHLRLSELWMLQLTRLCEALDQFVVGHLHSHKGEAFHSSTDDAHIFHSPGCFSLVIPRFAVDANPTVRWGWALRVGARGGSWVLAQPTQLIVHEAHGTVVLLSEAGPHESS